MSRALSISVLQITIEERVENSQELDEEAQGDIQLVGKGPRPRGRTEAS